MTAADYLNIILKNTYSLTQLNHRLSILKAYLVENLFASVQMKQLQPQDLSWLQSLPDTYFQSFNKDNIYSVFNQLESQKKALKLLTIYLTFEPDDATLAQIGETARKLFGNLLLDIKLDPNLIAGAALVWKGVYRDYSLRSKIEQKKGEVSQGFKKYLR